MKDFYLNSSYKASTNMVPNKNYKMTSSLFLSIITKVCKLI